MRPYHPRTGVTGTSIVFLLFLLAGSFTPSLGQDTAQTAPFQRADSLHFFKTRRDTIPRIKPIPLVGALEPFHDSTDFIVGSEIPWIEYRYLGDLLWTKPGMYIRDLGSPGQNNQLTVGGVDWRGIAFLVDGRSQSDPITGSYDMILFPTEYVERIEYITGPRAMVYGMNATGGAINVITKSYNTNKAYTRLRYSQGVEEYGQTDALFSQNIRTGLNFTFGLTRHTFGSHRLDQGYLGNLKNGDHDAWSFRTKVRYNISNKFDIVFSHLYHQTRTGLNGGVDYLTTPSEDLFNGLTAAVVNNDAYEKISNHHLDLTAAAYLAGDSSQVTTLTTFYSNQLREYRDEERIAFELPSNGIFEQSNYRSSDAGVLFRHVWESSLHNFNATAEVENLRVLESPQTGVRQENKLSASAKEEVHLFSPFTVAGFGRYDRYRGRNLVGYGADARLAVNQSSYFFAGASSSARTPTFQELYWSSDSTNLPTPRLGLTEERHTLIEAGVRFSFAQFFAGTVSLTHRVISNQILADTVGTLLQFTQAPDTRTYDGVNISALISYDDFYAQGSATYLKQPASFHGSDRLTLLPQVYLDGSIYFRGMVADGHLDLKVGFRGRFTSSQSGMAPLGESGVFVPYLLLQSFGPSGTVDFFAIGKLGDAYLHFIWENLSGNQYLSTPFYPMYDRNVRFGVSWEFWN